MRDQSQVAMLILAAGDGTRMRSRRPKVLHPLCGRSMLEHVARAGRQAGADRVAVVVKPDHAEIREALSGLELEFAVQQEPLGTAHAVLQARELLAGRPGALVVSSADQPLFRPETYRKLLADRERAGSPVALLTSRLPDPSGLGRIVRGPDGRIDRIVEDTEASDEVRAIDECNLCVYAFDAEFLWTHVSEIGNQNDRGEYFLTDVVELARKAGHAVVTSFVADHREALGINTQVELARAEAVLRERVNAGWMDEGVSFEDPGRTYVDADVTIGRDTWIAQGVSLRGRTRVGAGCRIDAHAVIEGSTLGDECWIKPHCHLEGARLAGHVVVGPSAHLRPDAELAEGVRVGNFVEIKNSRVGTGTKADHLAYIGDADVGSGVTFGCGTIVVNYDGEEKHRTTVQDGVFVGCNSNLVAPVVIEEEAYVAAGSTITHTVPRGTLAIARARQRIIEGWRERFRRRKTRQQKDRD